MLKVTAFSRAGGRRQAHRDHVELLRLQARDQAREVEVVDLELHVHRRASLLQQVRRRSRPACLRFEVHLRLELQVHAHGQVPGWIRWYGLLDAWSRGDGGATPGCAQRPYPDGGGASQFCDVVEPFPDGHASPSLE